MSNDIKFPQDLLQYLQERNASTRSIIMDKIKKISTIMIFVAMGSQITYLKFGDQLEARFPVIKNLKENIILSREPREEADVYALNPDGSAVDPRGYRKALMTDRKALTSIGRENPKWRNVIERGTMEEFQAMMRKGWKKKEKDEKDREKAVLREEDGSATHPWLYRKLWLKDKEKMATMKRDAPVSYTHLRAHET